MKKIMMIAFVVLIALASFGCVPKTEVSQKPQQEDEKPTEVINEEFKPNLGGIKLGDSKSQVIQSFGADYKQTTYDECFYLGEPFEKLSYNNGITVTLGLNSNNVLEIESNSPSITTNLGFEIGDKAQDVLDNYRSKYEEPDSRHGDGKLIGWFLINEQEELIIISFDKDQSWGNVNIEPDAQIEKIRLTNYKYMD